MFVHSIDDSLSHICVPCGTQTHKQIYVRMLEIGFTRKEIQESLSENSYDEVCATYYLLAKEVLRSREVNILLKGMSGYWAQWLVFL